MPMLGFAHGGYMLPILGTLDSAGVDAEAALAMAGLPPDLSQHPFRPIPHFLGVQFID
jgi:hypothetical protein